MRDRGASPAILADTRFAALIIVVAAAAIMLPEIATGLSLSDSYRFNLVWTEQFRDLARAGDPYPRWLPLSWDGRGSSTFYFYPPGFFWLAAAIDALISTTSAAVLVGSALAMRAWLMAHAGPVPSLLGAIAYMLAPYHLYDIYGRGALAESCAYLWMPLLALAAWRIAEARWRFAMLFAVAYAGLVVTHLPSTLLVSLFLLPPLVLFLGLTKASSRLRYFGAVAASGMLGIALAAFYLIPAIGLLPHVSADALVGPFLQPDTWFFWRRERWAQPMEMGFIILPSLVALLVVASAIRVRGPAEVLPLTRLLSGILVVAIVMVAGLVPLLWHIPPLPFVQFPWRLYVVVDFAVVTLVLVANPPWSSWTMRMSAAMVMFCLCFGIANVTDRFAGSFDAHVAAARSIREQYRDAPEYLPKGYPIPTRPGGAPDPDAVNLGSGPQVESDDPDARVTWSSGLDRTIRVSVDTPRVARITVRRFYFPHWRVTRNGRPVEVRPRAGDRLLSWTAPPGRSIFEVGRQTMFLSRVGNLISAVAAASLILFAFALRGRKRGENRERLLEKAA